MTIEARLYRHKRMQQLWERIAACHQSKKLGLAPKHLLILGVSGLGKSTLARGYLGAHPRYDRNNKTIVPVLYASLPGTLSTTNMYEALLSALGDPMPDRSGQRRRFFSLAEKCEVDLLIIDELHHFLNRALIKTAAAVTEELKTLVDTVKRPVILIGAMRSRELLRVNTQMRGRFMASETLKPFDTFSDAGKASFNEFVQGLLRGSVFTNAAFCSGGDILQRLFYATDGVPRNVMNLLSAAEQACIKSGTTELNCPGLEIAFSQAICESMPEDCNPFHIAFKPRRLVRTGEPYEWSPIDGDNHGWNTETGGDALAA